MDKHYQERVARVRLPVVCPAGRRYDSRAPAAAAHRNQSKTNIATIAQAAMPPLKAIAGNLTQLRGPQ